MAQDEEDDPGDVQGDGGPHTAQRAASAENRSGDTPGIRWICPSARGVLISAVSLTHY